ncbi:hypothetical protein FDP41_013707 [Naegleria fowleri]|uniref:Rhodanese domain-containing protein n=1 Tax=Naegleria fowleri TaxID=5763 RepID=A0A6A5BR16_NAEFO|nr:uncharacterized protein FDP41_013707 [Naegleria fowleri]KAF0980493.1 hypothetical protein FDP41_013707 [Naegleria fowleri]
MSTTTSSTFPSNNGNHSNDDHSTQKSSLSTFPLNHSILQSGKISKQELQQLITTTSSTRNEDQQQCDHHSSTASYLLLDVRSHQEVRGHHPLLPTAKHIPINLIYSAFEADDEDFEMEFRFSKPQPNDCIIVYCEHGVRSQMVQQILKEEFGYRHVINYEGSAHDWYSN